MGAIKAPGPCRQVQQHQAPDPSIAHEDHCLPHPTYTSHAPRAHPGLHRASQRRSAATHNARAVRLRSPHVGNVTVVHSTSPSSLDINKSEELRKTDSRRVPGSEGDVADLTSPATETQGLQTQHASQRRFHKAPGSTSGSDRRRGPPNFTPTSHLLLGVRSTSGEVARVRLSAAIMWCDCDSLPVAAMSSCAVGRTGVWRVATCKTGRAGAT